MPLGSVDSKEKIMFLVVDCTACYDLFKDKMPQKENNM